ncbi:MAG: hypothetical protein RIS45_1028 [Planctomycetota bacterium]|jgi:hypothetical protein
MHLYSKIFPPLIALALALVAINSADVVRKWWEGSGPAIEWHGVEVLTHTVRPGGKLEIVYTATIHRQCQADLRSFVVAPDETVPIRFPVVSGGYAQPSPDPVRIKVSITIPLQSDPGLSPLQSGAHTYRTVATRYCPQGVETDNKIPDAKFAMEVP